MQNPHFFRCGVLPCVAAAAREEEEKKNKK